MGVNRSENRRALEMIVPGAIFLVGIFLLPMVGVIGMAFADWSFGDTNFRFVGASNFLELARDLEFRRAFLNTCLYVLGVLPITLVLAVLLATALETISRGRTFYQATFFLPVMAATTAMALSWGVMLHPLNGVINTVLGYFGVAQPNWLRDPDLVLLTLIVIGIWQHLGFALMLVLAGLQGIPRELHDAASIDGADGYLDRLLTVTLPALAPILLFLSVTVGLRAFGVFDKVKTLTQGGPANASETLVHALYQASFEDFRIGYGATIAVVFLGVVIIVSLTQTFVLDRKVHYS